MVKTVFVIVAFLNLWTIINGQTNYCSLCANHIACNNPGTWASSCPADATLMTLSASDRTVLLNAHNEFRNNLAGGRVGSFLPAARMARIFWDDELAFLARLNVLQCTMRHDSCRDTPTFRGAGQNLAVRMSSPNFGNFTADLVNSVRAWNDEWVHATQSDTNNCCGGANFPRIGHFLQNVQDQAIRIGCGVARYTSSGWRTTLVACNYSRGNFIGTPVYVTGAAASRCTNGADATFTNLCR